MNSYVKSSYRTVSLLWRDFAYCSYDSSYRIFAPNKVTKIICFRYIKRKSVFVCIPAQVTMLQHHETICIQYLNIAHLQTPSPPLAPWNE